MTRECNGNCNFCQVEGSHKDTKSRFDTKKIVGFLKENCYSIQITGGEPLVRIRENRKYGNLNYSYCDL